MERGVVAAVEGVRPDALVQEEIDDGGVAPQSGQVEGRPAVCGVEMGCAADLGEFETLRCGWGEYGLVGSMVSGVPGHAWG